MSTEQKHSPTPWRVGIVDGGSPQRILEPTGKYIIRCWNDSLIPVSEAEANALFIVTACNSHDDLLAALEEFVIIGDEHADTCSVQPTWVSGNAVQGPCDCRYGRTRAAIAKASPQIR